VNPSITLFDRWIARPRRPWLNALLAIALLAAPLAAAALDGTVDRILTTDTWRLWLYPTIIAYTLAVAPLMARMDKEVEASFRLILKIPKEETERLIQTVGVPRPAGELCSLAVGALLGYFLIRAGGGAVPNGWLEFCWVAEALLMYALLAWVIYLSLVGSRLMTAIHRQPLHVDPFDLKPFEAIGRQGLMLALVFVGGITLSILFVGFRSENVRFVAFWLSYVPPLLVPVAIFFLIMLPTHRVLSAAKTRELEDVRRHIVGSCRALAERIESGQESLALSQQVLALSTYEKRLEQTPTWPYNTRMLRTLFFSVLVPAGTFGARVLGDVFFP
jgi:hypothetical protein